jgi:PTS system glucose-specific IIA component
MKERVYYQFRRKIVFKLVAKACYKLPNKLIIYYNKYIIKGGLNMFNVFSSTNQVEILAPLTGEVIDLSDVPDEVFAAKTVGDGIAIKPTNDKLLAPVDGVVKQLFPTKHALGIETEEGVEVLIHIVINTVELKGEGFEKLVNKGDKINSGDELIQFDLEFIEDNATSIITPIVITNGDQFDQLEKEDISQVTAGEDRILTVTI